MGLAVSQHNLNEPPVEKKDDDFDKAAKLFAKIFATVIAVCVMVIFVALAIKVLFYIW